MNKEEKHAWEVMLDYAFNYAPTAIPSTIWKYTKNVIEKFILATNGKYIRSYAIFHGNKKKIPQGVRYHLNDNYLNGDYFQEKHSYVYYAMQVLDEYEHFILNDDDFFKFIKFLKKYEATPKYELGKASQVTVRGQNVTVYQLVAKKSFSTKAYRNGDLVKKGAVGGFVQSEDNLSQEDGCWIDINSNAIGNARVEGNAILIQSSIYDNAIVRDDVFCFDSAIFENAVVEKNAHLRICEVSGNAFLTDRVFAGKTKFKDNVEVFGQSSISHCEISGDVWIQDCVLNEKKINGYEKIKNIGR